MDELKLSGGNNAQKVAIHWTHLRKDTTSISRTGFFWTPESKRKRGGPGPTWCRTSDKLENLGLSWAVAKKAQD